MRSKTAKNIIERTSFETKKKVRDYALLLIEKERGFGSNCTCNSREVDTNYNLIHSLDCDILNIDSLKLKVGDKINLSCEPLDNKIIINGINAIVKRVNKNGMYEVTTIGSSAKKLKIMFTAGLNCGKLHPDDDSYDKIHFEKAIKKCSKLKDDFLEDKEHCAVVIQSFIIN